MIPFLVVASVVAPGDPDMDDRIIERFDLDGAPARSVDALFADSTEVASAVTWISVVILVLAATSFTRAMQRMFQRAYGTEPAGISDAWRGLAWLAGFALWISLTAPLRESLEGLGGIGVAVVVATVSGFGLWLWTPAILLRGYDWRRLVPGALVSGMLGALLGVASSIYIPIVLDWSARRYGLIGVAFALQSWLLVFSFVVVIGAIVGAVVTEQFGVLSFKRLRERAH
jgi:membrane protein